MDKRSKEESLATLVNSIKRCETEFVKGLLLSCAGILNEPSPFAGDEGRTPLGIAALFGYEKIVGAFLLTRSKVLVNKGNYTSYYTAVISHIAVISHRRAWLSFIFSLQGNVEGITPLMDACSQGHVEVVRLLCDQDILTARSGKRSDVNACAVDGNTISYGGHLMLCRLIQLLFQLTRLLCYFTGTTALFEAARQGNVEMLRILCDAGAEVNQKSHGACVALHAAAWGGNLLAGRYLVSRGAYILKSDHDVVAKQFFHLAKKLVSPSFRHKNHVRYSGKFY